MTSINQQIFNHFCNIHNMWAEGYITIEIYLEHLEKNIDKFNDSAYYEPLLDTANLYRHHEYGERLFRIVDMLPCSAA